MSAGSQSVTLHNENEQPSCSSQLNHSMQGTSSTNSAIGGPMVDIQSLSELISGIVRNELKSQQSTSGSQSGQLQGIANDPVIPVVVIPPAVGQSVLPASQVDSSGSFGSLQDAVGTVLQINQGELTRNNISNDVIFDLPLGALLPEKVKSKIVAGEYIDLSVLIFPSSDNYTIEVEPNSKATIALSNPDKKNISNIAIWTSAMLVYGAVYLPNHVSEIAAFFKYVDFV